MMDISARPCLSHARNRGIIEGNRIDENGASVGSTHAASVHKSKGTRPMAYSNITYSTPQLNSPVIGGVA